MKYTNKLASSILAISFAISSALADSTKDKDFICCFTEQKKAISSTSFITDKDGNKHKTTKIGKQHWMAEDYKYEHSSSKCAIEGDNPDNCVRVYDIDRKSESEVKKICPTGWRLPTKDDFNELGEYLMPQNFNEMSVKQKRHARAKMSAQLRSIHWDNGEDTFGFNAKPHKEIKKQLQALGLQPKAECACYVGIERIKEEVKDVDMSKPGHPLIYEKVAISLKFCIDSEALSIPSGLQFPISNELRIRCIKE